MNQTLPFIGSNLYCPDVVCQARPGEDVKPLPKLCECGCGEVTPLATRTISSRGQIKGQPIRFLSRHNKANYGAGGRAGLGKPKSPEHRAKIRETKLGDRNPNWGGDNISYSSFHDWLANKYPKRGICEKCGAIGQTDHSFDHRLGDHTRNREDYRELCRSCHMRWDFEIGKRAKQARGSDGIYARNPN